MRLFLLLPLLTAVYARPQSSSTDWKPIEPESETHRLRENDETRAQKTAALKESMQELTNQLAKSNRTIYSENDETRAHKTTALKESMQELTNQLTKTNRTIFTMDTRTPPKIKFQQKEKKRQESIENSHPGVAVPIDVDSFFETTTQKRIIYRNENKTPTPEGGISTWILLSGQSTTSKPVRKQPTIKTTTSSPESEMNKTTFMTEKPIKGTIKIKPLTTRKLKTTTPLSITTKTSATTTTVATTAVKSTTTKPTSKPVSVKPTTKAKLTTTTEKNKLMTKIKASVLNNAVKNKTVTSTTVAPTSIVTTITTKLAQKTTETPVETVTELVSTSENTEPNELQPEAKEGTIELQEKSAPTTKRPRRPTNNKRKKNNNNNNNNNNKNRKRKPSNTTASEKIDTAVGNISKPIKEKPFGTQIYNYLSREIMPTVGVGLVGLMVTAGLASYFFYPFAGLRRTFDGAQDRKDYYYDEYSAGGMAEEELIGKVIAGMPDQTDYPSNSYRTHLARKDAHKNEVSYNYRNADSYYPYPKNNEYHTVSVGSKIGYGRDVVAEHQKETGYTVDEGEMEENQFVVGNVPKEFENLTPEIVPEHGPRSLRLRRFAQNDEDNEIIDFKHEINKDQLNKYPSVTIHPFYKPKISTVTVAKETTIEDKMQTTESAEKTTESTVLLQPEQPNFFSFVRNLLELKVRLGLDLLLRTTDSFSNYLRGVQSRVNNVLKVENSRTPPR